jgi:hypothetical protein
MWCSRHLTLETEQIRSEPQCTASMTGEREGTASGLACEYFVHQTINAAAFQAMRDPPGTSRLLSTKEHVPKHFLFSPRKRFFY